MESDLSQAYLHQCIMPCCAEVFASVVRMVWCVGLSDSLIPSNTFRSQQCRPCALLTRHQSAAADPVWWLNVRLVSGDSAPLCDELAGGASSTYQGCRW